LARPPFRATLNFEVGQRLSVTFGRGWQAREILTLATDCPIDRVEIENREGVGRGLWIVWNLFKFWIWVKNDC
jgi:hypothetical protein